MLILIGIAAAATGLAASLFRYRLLVVASVPTIFACVALTEWAGWSAVWITASCVVALVAQQTAFLAGALWLRRSRTARSASSNSG